MAGWRKARGTARAARILEHPTYCTVTARHFSEMPFHARGVEPESSSRTAAVAIVFSGTVAGGGNGDHAECFVDIAMQCKSETIPDREDLAEKASEFLSLHFARNADHPGPVRTTSSRMR